MIFIIYAEIVTFLPFYPSSLIMAIIKSLFGISLIWAICGPASVVCFFNYWPHFYSALPV